MFLTAVARPRFYEEGNCTLDGKIGMWPFVVRQPAQQESRNCPRGAIATTPINVDYETFLEKNSGQSNRISRGIIVVMANSVSNTTMLRFILEKRTHNGWRISTPKITDIGGFV
jgi:hypothetical protein